MLDVAASRFLGTPFRHQGRNPGIGLDCAGVLVCSLEAIGIPVNDARSYGKVPPRNLLTCMVERHGFRKRERQPVDGDVCLFWMRNKRLVIHCGIASTNGQELIHVESRRKVERVPMRRWLPQLAAVYARPVFNQKEKVTWQ